MAALRALLGEARATLASALPLVPPRNFLMASVQEDRPALERGVQVRSLLPREALGRTWIHAYARFVASEGGQVRAGASGRVRYVIADQRVAIVADGVGRSAKAYQARLTRAEGMVQALLAGFDAAWVQGRDLADAWVPLTDRQEAVLRATIAGATVETMARTLRVSARTVERELAVLRERFEVPTRAALVAEATRLGW